jgi:MFS family permease
MPWSGKAQWRKGGMAFVHTLQTFFYPHIFFITMLNAWTIAATLAAGYTVAPQLLAEPWAWPFLHLGFLLFAVLISAIAVFLVSGLLADWFTNFMAKRRGQRDPEFQALNLIPPTVISMIGTILFGIAGDNPAKYGWPCFLVGLGFVSYGFLATNSIGLVYVLECYPHLAGPALVNIGSFRSIFAFLLVFDVSEWIADMGYMKTMGIYTGLIGGFVLFIPVIFVFGPGWRKRWPGPTERVDVNVVDGN